MCTPTTARTQVSNAMPVVSVIRFCRSMAAVLPGFSGGQLVEGAGDTEGMRDGLTRHVEAFGGATRERMMLVRAVDAAVGGHRPRVEAGDGGQPVRFPAVALQQGDLGD